MEPLYKYAVAFISFFDNVMHMVYVEATNEREAALQGMLDIDHNNGGDQTREQLDEVYSDCSNLEEIKEMCFNGDCMVGVLQI